MCTPLEGGTAYAPSSLSFILTAVIAVVCLLRGAPYLTSPCASTAVVKENNGILRLCCLDEAVRVQTGGGRHDAKPAQTSPRPAFRKPHGIGVQGQGMHNIHGHKHDRAAVTQVGTPVPALLGRPILRASAFFSLQPGNSSLDRHG